MHTCYNSERIDISVAAVLVKLISQQPLVILVLDAVVFHSKP